MATPAKSVVLASWTFDSLPSGALASGQGIGPISSDTGSGTFEGSHADSGTTWSAFSGNGSNRSIAADRWAVGDYFQFKTSTLNHSSISVKWDQTSSTTGPADFRLKYSVDGSSFYTLGDSSYSVLGTSWSPTSTSTTSTYIRNLGSASPSADNLPELTIRLEMTTTSDTNGGTVASAGTSRIDNIFIESTPNPVPAPLPIFGAAVAFAHGRRLRRQALHLRGAGRQA